MSSIGRVFIVLNLVLAAAFVGWAASLLGHVDTYKKNLADANVAHETALKGKDDELAKLTSNVNEVTEQQRQMREARDAAKAEADRLKTQLDEMKRSSDALTANITKIQATLGDYNNTIAQLTQQKDAATERAHEAERARDAAVSEKDAAVMAQNDAEEATRAAQTQIGDLEGEKVALSEEVEKLNTRLAMVYDKTGIPASEIEAQAKIDGAVMRVERGLKFVVINKGRKDGVKEGYTFSIYRGSQFKGQVRIQDVQDGMCSGIIVNEKTPIETGDSATTNL
jgi:chromosome segregation ATPase